MRQTRVAIGSERLFAKSKWQTRDKCGKATCKGIVFFSTGDNSIQAAMNNGGIKKIHHVDVDVFNILNLYSTATTIVWGE